MKLKHLVAAFAALGFTAAASSEAVPSVGAQLSYLQAKVAKMEEQIGKTSNSAVHSPAVGGSVTFDRELSGKFLGFNSGAGTEMFLLNARHNGMAPNSLYLGGLLRAMGIYSNATVAAADSKSPVYLKSSTNSVSAITVPTAKLLFVGNINDFTTGVVELSASSDLSTVSVSQGYMMLGNLDESAFFGTVGKKSPTFGNFSTYNSSFDPLTRVFFRPDSADQASVGMTMHGATFVATVINGGTAGSDYSHLYTKNNNRINNYAVDFKFEREVGGAQWNVGAGYLHGYTRSDLLVIDNDEVDPGSNFNGGSANHSTVGLWNYNMGVTFNSLSFFGEYLVTDRTIGSSAPLRSISGYDIGAQYVFQFMGKDTGVHLDYSAYSQTRDTANTTSGTNTQWVAGLDHHCAENFQMGLEYARNHFEIGSAVGSDFNDSSVALRLQANF